MWIYTHTGRRFNLQRPDPESVDIEDIAHSLSMLCRYNGHCPRFFSVAEHSVLVSGIVSEHDALWGLLHDAAEAYIGDIARPVKSLLNNAHAIEDGILIAVAKRFDLPVPMSKHVKAADDGMLGREAVEFFGAKAVKDWQLSPYLADLGQISIQCLAPEKAKRGFLERFDEILLNRAEMAL